MAYRKNPWIYLLITGMMIGMSGWSEKIYAGEPYFLEEETEQREAYILEEETVPKTEYILDEETVPKAEYILEEAAGSPEEETEESWDYSDAFSAARELGIETEAAEAPKPISRIPEELRDIYKKNIDVVGWLKAGERIDYPVCQFDHDYYLHHDMKGNHDINGTLFVNEWNSLWPRDDVLVILGHNMRSGAMFGTLKIFNDFENVCKYPLISFQTIYDEEEVWYTPVAGFNASMNESNRSYFDLLGICFPEEEPEEETGMEGSGQDEAMPEAEGSGERVFLEEEPAEDSGQTVFLQEEQADPAGDGWILDWESMEEVKESVALLNPEEKLKASIRKRERYGDYLEEVLERSIWESPVDVRTDDDLLVLVTCSYFQDNGRFMLFCRKLRNNETPEEIRELYQKELETAES